jgi:hypothetical protein
MTIPIGTKLVIDYIKKEIAWRELCNKAGIDPKDTKVYTKNELDVKTTPKDCTL